MRYKFIVACLALACGVLASLDRAEAEYIMAPGDTIELTVAGLADLHQKATIDPDGFVRLPLLNAITASGLTLDALIEDVRRRLPQRAYRQRMPDGRENLVVIDPNEIGLAITSYRPVYVRGDVAKPGEQDFRPGMTVRQVISLAAGYDIMRFRMENPFLQTADLRAEYDSVWTEFARQQAHATTVRQELDGTGPIDLMKVIKVPIAPDVLADIVRVEAQQMQSRNVDYTRERSFLQNSVTMLQQQLDALDVQKIQAEQDVKQEADNVQKLTPLVTKGVIAQSRVLEQQRSRTTATEHLFDMSNQISDKQRTQADLTRQIDRTANDHRLVLLKELQEANVQSETLRSRLQALAEKLLYTGAIKSQLQGGKGSKPDVQVFHAGPIEPRHIQADEDTVLMAGDVVEVSLKAEVTPQGLSN